MEERSIKISAGGVEITVLLNDSRIAELVWSELPIEGSGSTWGDEIYFKTPVKAEEDGAREVVAMGDVGYWPPGQAIFDLRNEGRGHRDTTVPRLTLLMGSSRGSREIVDRVTTCRWTAAVPGIREPRRVSGQRHPQGSSLRRPGRRSLTRS